MFVTPGARERVSRVVPGNGFTQTDYLKKISSNLALMTKIGTSFTRTLSLYADVEGEEHIIGLKNNAASGIVGLFHYGPWELLPEIFKHKGYRIGAITGNQRMKLFGRYMASLRRRAGLYEIRDLASASRHLEQGTFVAVFFDKTRRAKGLKLDIPYPGYEVSVLPQRLSKRTGKSFLPVACGFKNKKIWVKIGSPENDPRDFFEPFFKNNLSEWLVWGE
jgi:lauroyl/myristoyl acyltransferase